MTGRHGSIEFSMMEAGHTKFSPDWHFGLWKVRWRNTTVSSLSDIARSVTDSSRNGHNIPQLVDDDSKPVVFSDWQSFLKEFFRPVPSLLSYHHFRMTSTKPGVVFVRKYATDTETEVHILKKGVTVELIADKYPESLPLPGLDPKRMWYLYDEIAPLCFNSDSACPKPHMPKPKFTDKQHKSSHTKVGKC